ncbi:MAG: hypothetical protein ACTSRG_04470 [Candidatus Helarchaeota archaeon]
MLTEIEKKISTFNFVSTKSEILIYLINFYLRQEKIEKAESLFNWLITILSFEPNLLARSKLCYKLAKTYLDSLNTQNFKELEYFTNTIISKIDSPYYKARILLNKLENIEKTNDIELIFEQIKKTLNYFQRILVNNVLFLIKNVINPIHLDLYSKNYVEQASLDQIYQKFSNVLSNIALKFHSENIFDISLKIIEKIRIKLLREEALKDVLKNYFTLALEENNKEIVAKIKPYLIKFEYETLQIEVFVNYSKFLRKEQNFGEIRKILQKLVVKLKNLKAEFSKAMLFKNFIEIAQNLEDPTEKSQFLNEILELSKDSQTTFSIIVLWLESLKIFNELNNQKKINEIFKKIIDKIFLINDKQLFYKLILELINQIPFLEIIDSNLILTLIEKLDNLDDVNQKIIVLIKFAENIKNSKFANHFEKIQEILQNSSQPFLLNGVNYTYHYYLFLKYVIRQAFLNNDTDVIENPLKFVEKAQTELEKTFLLLEYIKQFKNKKLVEKIAEIEPILMKKMAKISNEFERKEIMVRYIKILN